MAQLEYWRAWHSKGGRLSRLRRVGIVVDKYSCSTNTAEWVALWAACCKYKFGRVELMPVKKTGEAVCLLPDRLNRQKIRFSRRVAIWALVGIKACLSM